MKGYLLYILLLTNTIVFAQNKEKQVQKELEEAKNRSEKYTQKGNKAFNSDKPIQAEVDYRNAVAENKENGVAQYNLGTMYYKQKSYDEAFYRLKNASTSAEISYAEKHQIFHNLGNTFMKEKAYDKAVQAYQEALRNNPNDEETRYNLAVAKEMLKKNPPQNQNNKDNKKDDKNNQNKDDNKDNKGDNKENQQDKQNDNKDNQNKDDKQDKKDQNKDNQQDNKQDNKDDKNNKDNKSDKNNEGNKDDKNNEKGNNQDKPNDPKDGKDNKDRGEGKSSPASLSPEQMERILEAMNNEDRKVQEKINARKVKGERIKSEKDW